MIQNGSCTASSNVFAKGNDGVVAASRSSSNDGSSTIVMGRCFVNASTRGRVACPWGLIHTSHLAALRTASAPSTLFFGDRNKAYMKEAELVLRFLDVGLSMTYPTIGLDGAVYQQDVTQIICIMDQNKVAYSHCQHSLRGPI